MIYILLNLFISLNSFLSVDLIDNSLYQFKAKAKEGDGIYSLLRRYHINHPCNVDQFYKINNLDKGADLHVGKEYTLPVQIYNYNGRSIRSTIKKNEWDRAIKIKEYNELILKEGLRKTHYADSRILWVPYNLVECYKSADNKVIDQATIKNPNVKSNSLFGDYYKEYEVVDHSLKGKVFYIVSGHGGPDPGAMCKTTKSYLCEDEYAYDVSLRLARNLMQHGAKVEMIIQDKNDGIRDNIYLKCDRDETCNGKQLPAMPKNRLRQRASRINQLHKKYKKQGYKDHAVVVIHVDAAGSSARKDVFFYHHKKSKKGKRMAKSIHETFKKKYNRFQKGRGYKGTIRSRGLYMLNYTNPPTVFIELANIQNPNDQKRILLNRNRQALANWLFEGLIGF